ncbi:MAG: WYL domain-containing protein [Oscillospiraceae bacterium]|nr:WYL domain-containing protein [Oscillospiraceae bacterium]
MARSSNQKLKILYLMKALLENTDEAHPMTLADIIEYLAHYDIKAERKSIYDDLEALRTYGVDVISANGGRSGYFVGERDFQLSELKLLVDSVQSSKFIPEAKSLELIKKIEQLTGKYEAQLLQRQVVVRDRVKTQNKSVYINVDAISEAINDDKKIKFRYFGYSVSKERLYHRNGEFYEVSPFALIWDDENYYLKAWDDSEEIFKTYRVDKMSDICAMDLPRCGKEQHFDIAAIAAHSKAVFGMFDGQEQNVRMRFANYLAGAVIDRFGSETMLVPDGGEHFTVNLKVVVSQQFFAWVFGFGKDAQILSPDSVQEDMTKALAETLALYN